MMQERWVTRLMERFIIRQSTEDSQGKSREHSFKLVHSPSRAGHS
jgi:hypothetical protein